MKHDKEINFLWIAVSIKVSFHALHTGPGYYPQRIPGKPPLYTIVSKVLHNRSALFDNGNHGRTHYTTS